MAPLPPSILHTATHHTLPLGLFAIATLFFFLVCFYFSLPDTLPSAEHEGTHTHRWSPYANTWTMGFLSPQHISGTPQSTELRCVAPLEKNPHTFGTLVSSDNASFFKKERSGERQVRWETVTLQDARRGEECLGVGFSNIVLGVRTVVGDDGGEMTKPFPKYTGQFPEYAGQFLALEKEREHVEKEDREIEGNDVRLYEEKWRKWRDEKEPHTNLSPLSGCVF